MDWLFGGTDFMPRAACGQWETWVLVLYVIANFAVTGSYVAIPAALYWIRRRGGTTLPDGGLLGLFIAFILACGLGHTVETVVVWHPWYRFATLWHVGTAMISVFTVVAIAGRLPFLMQLRSPVELAEANRRLDAANKDLEQFAYCASHDLQEPLRAITSYGNLLLEEKSESFDDESRAWVNRMVRSATHMSSMVDDLLTFSRAGRSTVRQEVDLEVVFRDAVEMLAPSIEASKAKIEIGSLFRVEGDPTLLTLAAKNLLSNAIKYSPDGPRIEVFARDRGVFVRDHGIGIAPEHQHKIFDVFTRLHRNDQYQGTGIGLALVRRIVEHHGARTTVESAPGKGSTFGLVFEEEGNAMAVASAAREPLGDPA
jgi:signal transduction histidine kinase